MSTWILWSIGCGYGALLKRYLHLYNNGYICEEQKRLVLTNSVGSSLPTGTTTSILWQHSGLYWGRAQKVGRCWRLKLKVDIEAFIICWQSSQRYLQNRSQVLILYNLILYTESLEPQCPSNVTWFNHWEIPKQRDKWINLTQNNLKNSGSTDRGWWVHWWEVTGAGDLPLPAHKIHFDREN